MSVNLKCLTCSAVLVDHKTFTPGGLVKESGKWCPVCKVFKVLDKVEPGVSTAPAVDAYEESAPKHSGDELYSDLHRVIANYPSVSVYHTIGALEAVKMDLWSKLEEWNDPDAQKK